MRKSCLDCVRKHLGSAGVFVKETKMGYPDYDIWVIGELEHAADESLELNPDLAWVIREHRLAWMADNRHMIPFEAINKYVRACALAETSGMEMPELPDDVIGGLERNTDGSLYVHGDTRP